MPFIYRLDFFPEPEQCVHCDLGGTDRIFYGKDDVVRYFAELSQESKIGCPWRDYCRSIAFFPRCELARDIRHQTRYAIGRFQDIVLAALEAEMLDQLCHYFLSRTFGHPPLYEITFGVRTESVSPHDPDIFRLANKMRLVGSGQG